MVITNGQVVILRDIPVDTSQILVIGDTTGIGSSRTGIVAVLIHYELGNRVHVLQRCTGSICLLVACSFGRAISIWMPVGRDVLCLHTLNISKEEELVLQDWATESETPGFALVGIWLRVLHAVYAVTVHVLVRIVVVSSTPEGVRTRLRNSVDTTADEVRLAHVEGSDNHLHFVDGIH